MINQTSTLLPLRIVIIDNELHCREALKNLLTTYCNEVDVLHLADGVESGIVAVQKYKPDVVFLDVEMDDGTGFDLLNRLNEISRLDFDVVFTTAFEHYALKAIKISAIDFLMKPIDVDELIEAVGKIHLKRSHAIKSKNVLTLLNNLNSHGKQDHTITLATLQGLEFIKVSDIVYCEADGAYTKFHLKGKELLLVSKNLKEYENLLSGYGFFRTHNSFLINVSEVKRYVKGDGGYLVMNNGDTVGISSRKKESLIKLFEH